ncbi:hypothetical protein AWC38_SpisGene14158 [Stylophora pistillata]|uniref:ShKT domain-containing protein n=1 Tax=Stylophora pistillata TaxID=50429 RepID=A0A2B4RUT2_STYPI|nr:hypothetical protein AWC38_SpisGene14158 [Stylophora pistillata]
MPHTGICCLLLFLLMFIGIASAEFDDSETTQKGRGLITKILFEDMLPVFDDIEKRARCANRKSHRWCKKQEMFFHSCKTKKMKKNCQASCRQCG